MPDGRMTYDKWYTAIPLRCFTKEWQIDKDAGVYKFRADGSIIKATSTPIFPTEVYFNLDTKTEKVKLSFWSHGSPHDVTVPRSYLVNNTGIAKLADFGIDATSNTARALIEYFSEAIKDAPTRSSRSVLGWTADGFIPYSSNVAFDGDVQYRQLRQAVSTDGNLDEWISFVGELRKNIFLRLTMAASFASPLIEVVGENPFVLHLWGGTGSGKTVALMVAASVWGNPSNGKLVRTMNMTKNSMLATAAFLNNLPFVGDELQTIKSKFNNSYDQLIMQVTEGTDRGRMNNDKLNEMKSWRCSFLFSGEEPCVKEDSGGGVANRVIEVECTETIIADGNGTANFVRANYGHAAEAFIKSINKEEAQSLYKDLFRNLAQKDTTAKQAGAMALIMLGDELARRVFWNGEEPLRISDVEAFLRSENEVDVSERAYQYVVSAIAENTRNFDSDARVLWGKPTENGVAIIKSILTKLMEDAGFSLNACRKKWAERGYIETAYDGKTRCPIRVGTAVVSCIKIILPPQDAEIQEDRSTLPF